jgi:serine/threonine protein phosphatase PrpC
MRPGGRLSAANVGDCSFRIIRAGKARGLSTAKNSFVLPLPLPLPHLLLLPLADSRQGLLPAQVVSKARPQQHEFNMPYQLAHPLEFPDTDLADDAQLYELPVQPADVLVAGSDGLFDNMWDDQLCEIVADFLGKPGVTRWCVC